jgi:ribonucleoside-diphosphate reductase alpha chain
MAEKNIKPQLTHNALLVLKNRCLLKDKDGNILETESQLFQRVAHHAALAEDKYGRARKSIEKEFLEIMISLDFLPSSPILMNSGTPLGQLAACFVLPLNDSLKDIYRSIAEAAQIQASGGGVGFFFYNICAKGDRHI